LEPELPDLLWHFVNAIDDQFIRPASVVNHFTLIEPVVEKGANGAFREGFAIPGRVAPGVQILGQGPEGMLSSGVSSEGGQQCRHGVLVQDHSSTPPTGGFLVAVA
jgi:hypothetical protein